MKKDDFFHLLKSEVDSYNSLLETNNGDWIIKGFIDIKKNIYSITTDTKVVSKIIEIILIPHLNSFASKNNLELELPDSQNFYPDLTFKDIEGNLFAVDFKTTYRDKNDNIKGMTLGAFSGYFRDRNSTKNIQHPYKEYSLHLVLGIVYQQTEGAINEKKTYSINELDNIKSVIKNFKFFVQPKYKIAADTPGSGNTKNIGSVSDLNKLINGEGIFAKLGEDVFDDYWMNYLTVKDAKAQGLSSVPYKNLATYKVYLATKLNIANKLK